MLDTDTKRRIDTARDILVGKVPDPKSQVEQITIALIYKFMDDMDAQAEEMGGKRNFFAGEFNKYGWAKLMAPSVGGHELIGLYGEGIAKMPQNGGIPPLFRDIFKNAYLPYRDPETLKSFLKIINEFSYDHSERLGDAFEYLLPPLEVQKEIVAEIEAYQKVIDGARAVLDHYRPHIPINPEWPMVELGEVAEINPKKSEVDDLPGDTVVSFVPMADLGEHSMTFEPKDSKPLKEVGASYTYFRDNDVLIAKVTSCFENGKAGIARNLSNGIGFGSSEFFVMRCSNKLLPEWAFFSVANRVFRATAAEKMTGTGGLQRVPRAVLEEHAIPLPPLAEQEKIVAEIEAEQRLVEGNRQLIERMTGSRLLGWGNGDSRASGNQAGDPPGYSGSGLPTFPPPTALPTCRQLTKPRKATPKRRLCRRRQCRRTATRQGVVCSHANTWPHKPTTG